MTPVEILLAPQALTLVWPNGSATLSAQALRAACRCADCRAATLRGQPISVPTETALAGLEPLGHYALQLRFADGHERGIYPWAYLQQLAVASDAAAFR
ncbi:gamma-butyrobetaine hydroxylase-like domain-containing protein [Chitinolyticbacter albus]|uniref:gamma-butyrobetaine hydroxylase-like domain-containing protein n=1 Tax=Chitinolyticbacter albus TaxID=2961951 RepID=UPI00210D392A|nr:gamma-butyrobetaine hydroxylase-like domain-containing protein [Chitinolyticbacter albus]